MKELFKYRGINKEQMEGIDFMKEKASELLGAIEDNCPKSRETSLAITKLEECVMWASKAISHCK